jgi:HSP20 family protein
MSINTLSKRANGLTATLSEMFEPWSEWFNDGLASKSLTLPRVNISEDKDSYQLSLAAPGLQKKDFRIDVEGNLLTISAEKQESKEEKEEKYTRKEYNYSSFSRCFTMPEEVQMDKIEAGYENGVLRLVLPKTEKAIKKAQKSIPIK